MEVGANSRKIALTKNDGDTELKGEIEDWSYDAGTPANSTAFIHTSADGWTINANTKIWLYYDNDHADNANVDVINTVAGAAVWDNNLRGGWHLQETAGAYLDGTDNNNDSADLQVTSRTATGKLGYAPDFEEGSNDYIVFNDSASLSITGDITIEACINLEQLPSTAGHDFLIVGKWGESGTRSYFLNIDDADDKMTFRFTDDGTADAAPPPSHHTRFRCNTAFDAGDLGEWISIAVTADVSVPSITFYINGVAQAATMEEDGATSIYDSASPLTIGTLITDNDPLTFLNHFDGLIDEVKISSTIRTAEWNKGTYNSLWNSLLTYGSEETKEVNAIFFGANF